MCKCDETEAPQFLVAAEVAPLFRVSVSSVVRWAREHKVPAIQLPSGEYRFPRAYIELALTEGFATASEFYRAAARDDRS